MKCVNCGGDIDSTWTCIRCGEVHDEPMVKIKRMLRSREDEKPSKYSINDELGS